MTTAIKIENLSKKYVIGHQRQDQYSTFRDVLMHKFRGMGQRIRHPLSPNLEEVEEEEFWALRNINLEIAKGECVGIIGRNGAGKSTLLKVLSRITEPAEGRVSMDGRVASLLEVGTGFHPELSGRENIFLNGAILGMSKVEVKNKFDEIVSFSGTERFLDTPVKRYSSGMYVRLAFSVAAHLESDILIVDEVLAVGDAAFQRKCIKKMKHVTGHGKTVLFVSHNMASIRSLCNRAVLLNEGRLESQGDTALIVSEYLSKSVEEEVVALANRKDRKGSGSMMFQSLRCFDENDLKVNEIVSADYLRMVLTYKTTDRIDPKQFLLAVSFWDSNGLRVAGFFSDEMGVTWDNFGPEGDIILTIPSLVLRAGVYYIKIWSSSDRLENSMEKAIDVIERAATLTILPGDYWANGKSNRAGSFSLIRASYSTS